MTGVCDACRDKFFADIKAIIRNDYVWSTYDIVKYMREEEK